MQHVGNDAFIHPLPPLQQAFGQVCHRATIAELRQDGEKIITMKNMSRRVLPENNPPKSGASEAAGGAKEKKNQHAHTSDPKISQCESESANRKQLISPRRLSPRWKRRRRRVKNVLQFAGCACHDERVEERREGEQIVSTSVCRTKLERLVLESARRRGQSVLVWKSEAVLLFHSREQKKKGKRRRRRRQRREV